MAREFSLPNRTWQANKFLRVTADETWYNYWTSAWWAWNKMWAWDSTETYASWDLVNYNWYIYKSLSANTNKNPVSNPSDWEKYFAIKSNFWWTVAPTVNDDSTAWYEVWSRWIDTVANESYICLDNTAWAAIWEISTASLASEIINTPAWNISSTNIQWAIDELDTEKAGLALDNTFTGKNVISTTDDDQLTIKNSGDATGTRSDSITFEFSDGDGAKIKTTRPSIGSASDVMLDLFSGGNTTNFALRCKADGDVRVNNNLIVDTGVTISGLNTANGIVQTDGSGVLSTSVALPDGTTATTQSADDNSTKVATTAYVDAAVETKDQFTELSDTPANFTGSAGKYAKVNAGETAIEFGTISAVGASGTKMGSWDSGDTYAAGDLVNYNGVIYKSLSTNSNSQPDTNPADWEIYTKTMVADTITETTTDNWVNIENVNLKDWWLILPTLTDTNYWIYNEVLSEDTSTAKIGRYVQNLETQWTQTNSPVSKFFDLQTATYCSLSNRTTEMSRIKVSRTNTETSWTVADNYDVFTVQRRSVQNWAWWTYTADWSVVYFRNTVTETAWTMTDDVTIIEFNQSSLSTWWHFRFNVYTWTPITNNTFWYDWANLKYLDNSWNTITLWNIPLTTKWDIFTFDTDWQRLAVWTDWQVLTADSWEATWLKWADASWWLDSAENLDVDTWTETVDTFADTDCDACHWHYLVKKWTNLRTWTIMSVWEATWDTVEYTETSTNDIWDTSDLTFTVDINTDNVRLLATTTSDDWVVKVKRIQI